MWLWLHPGDQPANNNSNHASAAWPARIFPPPGLCKTVRSFLSLGMFLAAFPCYTCGITRLPAPTHFLPWVSNYSFSNKQHWKRCSSCWACNPLIFFLTKEERIMKQENESFRRSTYIWMQVHDPQGNTACERHEGKQPKSIDMRRGIQRTCSEWNFGIWFERTTRMEEILEEFCPSQEPLPLEKRFGPQFVPLNWFRTGSLSSLAAEKAGRYLKGLANHHYPWRTRSTWSNLFSGRLPSSNCTRAAKRSNINWDSAYPRNTFNTIHASHASGSIAWQLWVGERSIEGSRWVEPLIDCALLMPIVSIGALARLVPRQHFKYWNAKFRTLATHKTLFLKNLLPNQPDSLCSPKDLRNSFFKACSRAKRPDQRAQSFHFAIQLVRSAPRR